MGLGGALGLGGESRAAAEGELVGRVQLLMIGRRRAAWQWTAWQQAAWQRAAWQRMA